jgi:hypothetical protein
VGAKSCAVEAAVQTDDFEDTTFCRVVGGKPLLTKGLRKFKHFGRQLGRFVAGTVDHIELQFDRCHAVAKFRVLSGEEFFADFIAKSHFDEPVLLAGDQGLLAHQFCTHRSRLALGVFCLRH